MALIKQLPKGGNVSVIGAGISGLTFTYFLTKLRPDVKVTIYESRSQPGGWIRSEYLNVKGAPSILLEKGPRTLRGVSDGTLLIIDILKNLSNSDQIEVMRSNSIANRKYILGFNDELVEVPSDIKTGFKFMTNELTDGFFKGIVTEPFSKSRLANDKDESIASFFQRKFRSSKITDNVMSAVLHGIYAGDVRKLSVRALLPKLVELEETHGSIMKGVFDKMFNKDKKLEPVPNATLNEYETLISPDANLQKLKTKLKPFPMLRLDKGLQQLPLIIASSLSKNPQVSIKYDSKIAAIDLSKDLIVEENGQKLNYNHLRSTINTNSLAKLINNNKLSSCLSEIEYVTVFLVNIYSPKQTLIPKNGNGFGFLVPLAKRNHESLLGVIYDSDTEQNTERLFGTTGDEQSIESYNKITLMMGGHFYNSLTIPSNSLNIEAVKKVLTKYLKVDLSNYNLILRDEANMTNVNLDKLDDNDLIISYNLHENCIPQYNVGYNELKLKVATILDEDLQGSLSIGGMCFGNGVGVPDCVMNGLEDALKMK